VGAAMHNTRARFMAAQNNGHITRQERRALNQQENGVSKEIHQ
jgi:hypothetical protein